MTNIIPQAPKNNQITWPALENYSRTLATAGNELSIYFNLCYLGILRFG
jgi:endonuclease G